MKEEEIRVELEIVKLEIEVVKSLNDENQDEVFTKILNLRMKSPLYTEGQDGHSDSYVRWLKWNVYDNKLPYPSSGSFLVAVEDYDNNIYMLGDNPSDEQCDLFDKVWDELFK